MKKVLIAIALLVGLSSCEKFLNVNPINKAYEEDLLKDRSGFEAALGGAYESLASDTLYGRDMKYGLMETLVGSYSTLGAGHKYYRLSRYEYNYDESKKFIKEIWSKFYKTINQVNVILKNIDHIQSDPSYNLVKGEAIGLRAFAHFQLLKLFGPSFANEGGTGLAIPYKTEVSFQGVKFSTASEVIKLLKKDLMEARALLENDPIRTQGRGETQNQFDYEKYNSLIDYRVIRMNYYAIIALQAMVAQWEGDLVAAGAYAEELIAEVDKLKSIRLATNTDFTYLGNVRLPMESVFALFTNKLATYVPKSFVALESSTSASTSPYLFPNYTWLNTNLYNKSGSGSTNDNRLTNWFSRPNTSYPWKLSKYLFDFTKPYTDQSYKIFYENKVISLHTIYMIAAESYASKNPTKSFEYLNKVRNARNITTNLSYTSSITEKETKDFIFDEMRKENIAEGYLFTEYKRLFRAIDRSPIVQPKKEIFNLPIPDDELLFNPQN
ncbi:MAG: RagB/SusD family nutrient uptake outer membrane protein [Sphingobacterium sp.]|jgi:hypothetical protein|nr:RagB/SusD family nutrient uptake outer membrane protein [Sphingobacterium sp.]